MNDERRKKLIVGLGNPGREYENTRHNIGFQVLRAFGKKHNTPLVRETTFIGQFAKVAMPTEDVFLLLPMTYMNDSGVAVRRCLDFYKISFKGLLVVADDIEFPLGTLRMRSKGRCGGHNGLRDIETRLGTTEYSRLRVGVGSPTQGDLSDYVLGAFSEAEEKELPLVIDKAVELIASWLKDSTLSCTTEIEKNK